MRQCLIRGRGVSTFGPRRPQGFTLTELMIVVAIIGLLLAVSIPNVIRARDSSRVKICVRNLRTIDGAKSTWAFETRKTSTAIPTTNDIAPYLQYSRMPDCPAAGTYRVRSVQRYPSCSYASIGHTLYNLNMDDDPAAD